MHRHHCWHLFSFYIGLTVTRHCSHDCPCCLQPCRYSFLGGSPLVVVVVAVVVVTDAVGAVGTVVVVNIEIEVVQTVEHDHTLNEVLPSCKVARNVVPLGPPYGERVVVVVVVATDENNTLRVVVACQDAC